MNRQPRLRADLHVHSYHSGYASHLRFLKTRDSYSDPDDIYRVAKARGMDLVCLTDHDSLDGCLEYLDRHPDASDFIAGEEIECTFPARTRGERTSPPVRIHIGALEMTERIHREVQPLRGNVFDVVDYLRGQGIFFALNHLFFFYHREIPAPEYVAALLAVFSALEVRNGAMCREHNDLIAEIVSAAGRTTFDRRSYLNRSELARSHAAKSVSGAPSEPAQVFPCAPTRFALTGGSDAHTLAHIGRTWTEAPGRTREEFLAALKAGTSEVGGDHGSIGRVARQIYSVIGSYWAGLIGWQRHDLGWRDRTIGTAFTLGSLPFQFTPAIVAFVQKSRERAIIQHVRKELQAAGTEVGVSGAAREAPVTS